MNESVILATPILNYSNLIEKITDKPLCASQHSICIFFSKLLRYNVNIIFSPPPLCTKQVHRPLATRLRPKIITKPNRKT